MLNKWKYHEVDSFSTGKAIANKQSLKRVCVDKHKMRGYTEKEEEEVDALEKKRGESGDNRKNSGTRCSFSENHARHLYKLPFSDH